MANNATIGLAVAGGYLLGRTRKAKMAISLGMFVAGRKLNLGPQLGKLVTDSPVLGELGQTVRTQLIDATTAAASSALTRRANSLADALHERTLRIGGTPDTDPEEDDDPEDASADDRGEADTSDDRPPEEQEAPRRKSTQSRRTTAGRTRTAAAQSTRKAGGARKAAGGSRKAGARGGGDA